jgi:hypothetical protein
MVSPGNLSNSDISMKPFLNRNFLISNYPMAMLECRPLLVRRCAFRSFYQLTCQPVCGTRMGRRFRCVCARNPGHAGKQVSGDGIIVCFLTFVFNLIYYIIALCSPTTNMSCLARAAMKTLESLSHHRTRLQATTPLMIQRISPWMRSHLRYISLQLCPFWSNAYVCGRARVNKGVTQL